MFGVGGIVGLVHCVGQRNTWNSPTDFGKPRRTRHSIVLVALDDKPSCFISHAKIYRYVLFLKFSRHACTYMPQLSRDGIQIWQDCGSCVSACRPVLVRPTCSLAHRYGNSQSLRTQTSWFSAGLLTSRPSSAAGNAKRIS